MKLMNKFSMAMLAGGLLVLASCDKTKPYETTIPSPAVHFNKTTTVSVLVEDPAPPVVIEVGTTDVSDVDRTAKWVITSPTGATSGVQYSNASSGTVSFPAGQVIANITIQPIPGAYPIDARDTLYLALQAPDLEPAQWGDTLMVILRGESSSSCSEDNPVMAQWAGDFTNCIEIYGGGAPYGPYTATISNPQVTGPTTGSVDIANVGDFGWGPITFSMDWSTTIPTITVVSGVIPGSDAGDLNPAYAGKYIVIRPHPSQGNGGFYSFCQQTLHLEFNLGVAEVDGTILGYFASLVEENMAR